MRMSHMLKSQLVGHFQIRHTNETCHTYEWELRHNDLERLNILWVGNMHTSIHIIIFMHTSIHIITAYERVMSHIEWPRMTHTNETCHTYEWVMPHVWTNQFMHMNESWHTSPNIMSHIWMSHVTHLNGSCHTCKIHKADTVTGWRRPTRCLKLQVICHKRATNHRALFQKMT